MNEQYGQFLNFLGSLPLSRKISMAFTIILVVAGFAVMFMWANHEDYRVLFNNLSPEDGGAIVAKLKEQHIPYRVEGNGGTIMVPEGKVYELRLTMAAEGLPRGGNVGFEIFDHTDFRTTKFVQELNYRRALQGELERTINQFDEVKGARVFIVLPKDSLFVEESRPASASIQLDLNSNIPPNKISAIVHLVASAVEGLDTEQVTVVDTKGRVLFKGESEGAPGLLNSSQLAYKKELENEIRNNVQTMLEGIVGQGKAIVRVNAEIDFEQVTLNKEEYDPSTTAVRSMKNLEESENMNEAGGSTTESIINNRRGVISPGGGAGTQKQRTKKNVITNYEINKVTKTIIRPAGKIKRLSVAAVIDGTYQPKKMEDGTIKKQYVPRSDEELKRFEDLVKKAMGYSEDREDQVSVSSIPFSAQESFDQEIASGSGGFDILTMLKAYRKAFVNLVLVVLVFFLVVRPLLKGIRGAGREAVMERRELPAGEGLAQIPETGGMNHREKILQISAENPEKTAQLIKGWLGEQE